MVNLRAPLARARGLGAAGGGTRHWWMQRVTAIALAPLALWFVGSLVYLAGADHDTALRWLRAPADAVLMLCFIGALFYHAMLGVEAVLEDYVHAEGLKIASLLAVKFVLLLLALFATLAVLHVALGG